MVSAAILCFADKEYPWSLGEVNGGGISRHTEVVGL